MRVKSHTSIKHRILGYYYKICVDVMKSGRNLSYIDLYAGDGICKSQKTPRETWNPPYIESLLEKAKNNDLNLNCFFNDRNSNNIQNLKNRLSKYKNFISRIYQADANRVYKKILPKISPKRWSIFSLDPFKHSQLDFSTIEKIANHSSYDNKFKCERRPEQIITFMTYTIAQHYKKTRDKKVSEKKKEDFRKRIDRSLGTKDWRNKIDEWERGEVNIKFHRLFLEIFLKKLKKLGYKTVEYEINQTVHKSLVYYLIFATSIPFTYEKVSEDVAPRVRKLKQNDWVKKNFEIHKMEEAKEKGNKLIDEYF